MAGHDSETKLELHEIVLKVLILESASKVRGEHTARVDRKDGGRLNNAWNYFRIHVLQESVPPCMDVYINTVARHSFFEVQV